jgi:hypothetical protein
LTNLTSADAKLTAADSTTGGFLTTQWLLIGAYLVFIMQVRVSFSSSSFFFFFV